MWGLPHHIFTNCVLERPRDRELCHVLIHSLKAYSSQNWDRQEPGTRSVPVSQVGGRKSRVEPSPAARQGAQEPGGALAVLGPHVDAPVWEMVS